MKIYRWMRVTAIFTLTAFVATSCGNAKYLGSKIVEEKAPVSNFMTQGFNKKLADMNTEEKTVGVVNDLTNYMASRIKETATSGNSQIGAQSINANALKVKALLKGASAATMAQTEYRLRSKKKSIGTASIEDDPDLVSVDQLADQINSAGESAGVSVKADDIALAQQEVRKSVPNLALDENSSKMSPLEATTVAWVFATGDDGTTPAESIEVSPQAAFSVSSQSIHSQAIVEGLIAWVVIAIIVGACVYKVYLMVSGQDGYPTEKDTHKQTRDSYGRTRDEITGREYYFSRTDLSDVWKYVDKGLKYQLPSGWQNRFNQNGIGSQSTPNLFSMRDAWAEIKNTAKKGDLIFISWGNDPKYATLDNYEGISHVAMILDPQNGIVLDSLPGNEAAGIMDGPAERNIYMSWPSSFNAIQIIRPSEQYISSGGLNALVDRTDLRVRAGDLNGVSFRPVDIKTNDVLAKLKYFAKFLDKNAKDSMYCSKFIYTIFMEQNVNLDQNLVRIDRNDFNANLPSMLGVVSVSSQTQSAAWNLMVGNEFNATGQYVQDACKGIFPEDIFFSPPISFGKIIYSKGGPSLLNSDPNKIG